MYSVAQGLRLGISGLGHRITECEGCRAAFVTLVLTTSPLHIPTYTLNHFSGDRWTDPMLCRIHGTMIQAWDRHLDFIM